MAKKLLGSIFFFWCTFLNNSKFEKFRFPEAVTKDNPVPLGIFLDKDVEEKFYFSQRAVDGMRSTKNSIHMNKCII